MGWGDRVHRPVSSGLIGGRRLRHRSRVVLSRHELTIEAPMENREFILPAFPHDLNFATDLYQRIFLEGSDPDLARTVSFEIALYSAPLGGGGELPDETSTWTVVPESVHSGNLNITHFIQQIPSWFDGLEFVDMQTMIYQPSFYWTKPFTVVHELWGNEYRWARANPQGEVRPFYGTDKRDVHIRLEGWERG